MSTNSSLSFGAWCPSGGTWQVCGRSVYPFVGCCTSNACGTGFGCLPKDIRAMSFNATWQGGFQDQKCPPDSKFFTCAALDPPFMGCCADFYPGAQVTDYGCREKCNNITFATLNGDDFLGSGPSLTLSPSGAPTAAPTTDPTAAAAPPATSSNSLSTGAIAGIAVAGALIGIALIAGLIWFLLRRRRRSTQTQEPHSAPPAYTLSHQNTWNAPPATDPKERNSVMSGSTYFNPSSPPQDQYAKFADPRMSQMSVVQGSPPMTYSPTFTQGGFAQQTQQETIHELPPAEPVAPVEIGESSKRT